MKRSKKSLYSEMILLYHIDSESDTGQKLNTLCQEMNIPVKYLTEKDLESGVGQLAEMSILQDPQTTENPETPSLPTMILRGFASKRIDELFSKMREKGDYVEYFIPDVAAQAYIVQKDQPYVKHKWTVWEESVSGSNGYLVFLCGDAPMIQIDTGTCNGKSIVVVKESYGNAFVPFLIPHYEHIYVVDERYFQTSLAEFIQQNGVNDLLFLNNAFSAMTGYHANNLKKLMYQVYVPPEQTEEESQAQNSRAEEPKWQGVQEDDIGNEDDDE